MTYSSVKTVATDDPVLSKIQDNLAHKVDEIGSSLILDGRLIEGIVLTTGAATLVSHTLGRPVKGWFVVKTRPKTAPPATPIYIWDIDIAVGLRSLYLSMWADQNCTVSLWVF